jgi:hypothetical protein
VEEDTYPICQVPLHECTHAVVRMGIRGVDYWFTWLISGQIKTHAVRPSSSDIY